METKALDEEMKNYFVQLDESEKKSVIHLLKTFLLGRKKVEYISVEQYNKELQEAEAEIQRGESYSHEEVIKMSGDWLNEK